MKGVPPHVGKKGCYVYILYYLFSLIYEAVGDYYSEVLKKRFTYRFYFKITNMCGVIFYVTKFSIWGQIKAQMKILRTSQRIVFIKNVPQR